MSIFERYKIQLSEFSSIGWRALWFVVIFALIVYALSNPLAPR